MLTFARAANPPRFPRKRSHAINIAPKWVRETRSPDGTYHGATFLICFSATQEKNGGGGGEGGGRGRTGPSLPAHILQCPTLNRRARPREETRESSPSPTRARARARRSPKKIAAEISISPSCITSHSRASEERGRKNIHGYASASLPRFRI